MPHSLLITNNKNDDRGHTEGDACVGKSTDNTPLPRVSHVPTWILGGLYVCHGRVILRQLAIRVRGSGPLRAKKGAADE